MLVISRAQLEILGHAARARFEADMVKHLAARSVFHAQVLGDAGLLAAVRFGIDRAAARGYSLRGSVRLWLELMFLFGGYFDDDPLLPPEAAPFITCTDPDRQMQFAERVQAVASDVLMRISGPDNVHNRTALGRLRRLAEGGWAPQREGLQEEIFATFAWAHPHKVEVLGEAPHRRLIAGALGQAEARGITTPAGMALFPVLAFIAGAGFARDPLYPWISRTLDDARSMTPDERAARLERRARTYLDHVVANLRIT